WAATDATTAMMTLSVRFTPLTIRGCADVRMGSGARRAGAFPMSVAPRSLEIEPDHDPSAAGVVRPDRGADVTDSPTDQGAQTRPVSHDATGQAVAVPPNGFRIFL